MNMNIPPDIPSSMLAFVTNSSISTVRAVKKGTRKDKSFIQESKEIIENFLISLRDKNINRK